MLLTTTLFLILSIPFLGLALAVDRSGAKRLEARLQRVRDGTRTQSPTRPTAAPTSVRRRPAATLLGSAGHQLGRLVPRSELLQRQLDQAGIRVSVSDWAFLCLVGGCVVGGAAYLFQGVPWWLALGAGTTAALGVPRAFLRWRAGRRKRRFIAQFPDAIDLVVRGVKSGLPVTECLQSVAEELPNQVGHLLQEVTGNIKLGRSLDEALLEASAKIEVPEFKFFVISLAVQQETGGNLAEILENLVALMRRRSQVKLKIRAMSSEARASALIIGSLPFVMFAILYLVDSGYVMRLFLDERGWVLLAGAATSLGLGLAIIAKMVRFEI